MLPLRLKCCISVLLSGKVHPSLQKASVPLIARDKCSSPAVYGSSVTSRMICAGFLEGGVDACQVRLIEFNQTTIFAVLNHLKWYVIQYTVAQFGTVPCHECDSSAKQQLFAMP